jgi:hypothetical protein
MITLGQIHAQKIMSGRYAKIHTKFEKSSWNALSVSMQRVLSRSIVKTHGIVVKERTSTDS